MKCEKCGVREAKSWNLCPDCAKTALSKVMGKKTKRGKRITEEEKKFLGLCFRIKRKNFPDKVGWC